MKGLEKVLAVGALGLYSLSAGCGSRYDDYSLPVMVREESPEQKQMETTAQALPRARTKDLCNFRNGLFDAYKTEEWRIAKSELKSLVIKTCREDKEGCIKAVKSSNIRLKIAGLEALAKWEKDDPEMQKLAIEEAYNCVDLCEYISGGRRDIMIVSRNPEYASDLSNDGEQNNAKDFADFGYFLTVADKLAKYGGLAIPASLDRYRILSEYERGRVAVQVLRNEGGRIDKYSKELISLVEELADSDKWAVYNPGIELGVMLEEIFRRNQQARLMASKSNNFYIKQLLNNSKNPHGIVFKDLDPNSTTEDKFVEYELERDLQRHDYLFEVECRVNRGKWSADRVGYLWEHFGGDRHDREVYNKHHAEVKKEAVRKYREALKK